MMISRHMSICQTALLSYFSRPGAGFQLAQQLHSSQQINIGFAIYCRIYLG
jgi:hypothetical protein